MLSRYFKDFSVDVGDFVIGLSKMSSCFFLLTILSDFSICLINCVDDLFTNKGVANITNNYMHLQLGNLYILREYKNAANTSSIQYFCLFAVKARHTTLIIVECITFHLSNLPDDMHKILAVFTGHKLRFWYLYNYTPIILKYSRSSLTLILK